jgi:hypothetical protein
MDDIVEALRKDIEGMSDAARVSLSVPMVQRAIRELQQLRQDQRETDAGIERIIAAFNQLSDVKVNVHDMLRWYQGPMTAAIMGYPGVTPKARAANG